MYQAWGGTDAPLILSTGMTVMAALKSPVLGFVAYKEIADKKAGFDFTKAALGCLTGAATGAGLIFCATQVDKFAHKPGKISFSHQERRISSDIPSPLPFIR